ncbi:MAG: hypothetical protein CO113_06605 [Elusimicrobia bacterium CG_4_9_14_3_um_filter_62_55]|nr:MAG: hypothetical protein CO113_06605 [Elusimicrobia bacterium CG_4_9_14_3_um_filter_62_55]
MPDKKYRDLGDVMRAHPEAAELLHKHGIHTCSGCYITFFSDFEKAAAYHAVPDVKKFVADLKAFLEKRS